MRAGQAGPGPPLVPAREPGSAEQPADTASVHAELATIRGLLAITLVMMERRQERDVLHLAATAVPGLVGWRTLGVHLEGRGWVPSLAADAAVRAPVEAALGSCPPSGRAVPVETEPHLWVLPLQSLEERLGHLVVAGQAPPSSTDLVLLRSLAQQTGVAVANARLHASREAANAALAESVAALQSKTAIHDRLTQVALTGTGYDGIVQALFELTGLPAGIEDRGGTLLAWAGPEDRRPGAEHPGSPGPAEAMLPHQAPTRPVSPVDDALRSGRPVRSGERLLAAARPRSDVVGVLFLDDPDHLAGETATVALEHGATVLAIELARLVSLAETELRLGVGVVSDLVSGSDVLGASRRAQALGRDLTRPHRVTVIGAPRSQSARDAFTRALGTAMSDGHPPLLMQRGATVVLLLEVASTADRSFVERLQAGLRGATVAAPVPIGVGGVCNGPEEYPRSYREGQIALRVPRSRGHGGVAVYDDLGVYQLLAELTDRTGLDAYVHRWLGDLLDYDTRRGAQLVATLACFLDHGGRYDATAAELAIGRSTLRYRLSRIRELSGLDLSETDTRFQLHLAVKALSAERAARMAGHPAPGTPSGSAPARDGGHSGPA